MSAIGGRGTIRTATRPALALTAVCTALAALLWQPPTAYAQTASQWQLADLRASLAWRLSTGDGVTVAVLDSGVDAYHRDLAGRPVEPRAQGPQHPHAAVVGRGAADARDEPVAPSVQCGTDQLPGAVCVGAADIAVIITTKDADEMKRAPDDKTPTKTQAIYELALGQIRDQCRQEFLREAVNERKCNKNFDDMKKPEAERFKMCPVSKFNYEDCEAKQKSKS